MKMEIKQICTAVFLILNSWKDWRKHEISLWLTGMFAFGGIFFSIAENRAPQDFLVPAGISLFFLALAPLSGGGVGMGDGLLLLSLGTMADTEEYIRTLCLGLLLAAAWSGFLMTVCKKGRKTEIPLVPFLFLGYLGGGLW